MDDDFKIPILLVNEKIRIRPLTIEDASKDYDAVMSSIDHLNGIFGNNWPPNDLTFEEEILSLKMHQRDMENRASFTYSVLNLDESKCLGCVYIYPSHIPSFDAVVFLWVRKSEYENGLDDFLYSTVKKWLKERWSFTNVAFPGREISWEKWNKS